MLLLIPVNAVISMKQRKLQVDLMKFKDKRLKLMSEVLNGMKVHVHTLVEPHLSISSPNVWIGEASRNIKCVCCYPK